MRRNARGLEPGAHGERAQTREEVLPCHGAAARGNERRIAGALRAAAALRAREQLRAAAREVGGERVEGGLAHGHDPLLAPFADHPHQTRPAVDGAERQRDQLRDAQPRAV